MQDSTQLCRARVSNYPRLLTATGLCCVLTHVKCTVIRMAGFRGNLLSDEDEWSDSEFWEDDGQFDLIDHAGVMQGARVVPAAATGNDTDSELDEDGALGSDVEVEDDLITCHCSTWPRGLNGYHMHLWLTLTGNSL